MYVFCRQLKYLKPHRQTVCTQISLIWAKIFASMLMLNKHFQMQLFFWRFKDQIYSAVYTVTFQCNHASFSAFTYV